MADQRVNFYQLFKANSDGSFEPLRAVRLGGAQLGPGVRFGQGVMFGGIDLTAYVGRDFLVDNEEGVAVMKGIF
jgi:hypothetical protein